MPVNADIFVVPADLTIAAADELRGRLLNLLNQNTPAEVDLSSVESCDAAGVQLLCSLRRSAEARKLSLNINDPSPAVLEAAIALGISPEAWTAGGAHDSF